MDGKFVWKSSQGKGVSMFDGKDKKINLYLVNGLGILLVFVLLYPKLPVFNIPGTYVAIRIEDLLIAILVGLWGLFNIGNLKNLVKQNITQAFILFWFIGLVSLISALLITNTILPHLGFLHWLRRVEVMLLFFVAASVVRTTKKVQNLMKVLFIVNLVVVFYGFGQIYLNFPVISTTNSEFSKGQILTLTPGARPNATFAGHYDLAVYLSIALVFLGCLFMYYKKLWERGLIVFSWTISFLMLGFTAARVSFLAALVALALAFWLMGKKILIGLLFAGAILVVIINPELRHRLVATVTVNLLEGGGPKYTPSEGQVNSFTPESKVNLASRDAFLREATMGSTLSAKRNSTISADIAPGEPINTTELGVYRSYNIRTDVEWPRAIRAFERNPLLGTGYSSISLATDNDYLRSLGEVGILGTFALGLVFFTIFKRLLWSINSREKYERLIVIASLCSLVAVLITGLFIDVLEASKVATLLWITLGVAWGLTEDDYEKNS